MSRLLDARYEEGYRDGESSAHADWTGALSEVLPTSATWRELPTKVAEYVEQLQARQLPLNHVGRPRTCPACTGRVRNTTKEN